MGDFDSIMDIQRNMANRVARENAMDSSLKLLEIIQSLVGARNGRVAKELIFIETKSLGLLQAESEVLLRELIRNGSVSEDGSDIVLF